MDDAPKETLAGYGDSLTLFYDNLRAAAMDGADPAWDGNAATDCERIVETILSSADDGGAVYRYR